jgi:hypothetical protein
MKRRNKPVRTRRKFRRRGGTSKCHAQCKHECPTMCRKLCYAASTDDEYNRKTLADLLVVKEELKRQINEKHKTRIDELLKKETYSDREKEAIRKLLESTDTDEAIKAIFLDKQKGSRFPVLRGGYPWLKYYHTHNNCETDCSKRCSESCDFLCKESVIKTGSKYAKEFKLLSSEISMLRSLLGHT